MKKAAVINDISGFGKCSLTVAIPVLSVMGIQACPLPTAVLTNQTGYESFYCDDYTDKIDIFTNQWYKMGKTFDGIYTGYFANEKQVDKVLNFVDKFKTENTLMLVDPIMADGGEVYSTYTKKMCDEVKKLAGKADVITPNLTELCILADVDYNTVIAKRDDEDYLSYLESISKLLINDTVKIVVVTGIEVGEKYIYNGIFTNDETVFCRTSKFGEHFSGTGDLYASVIFGALLNGETIKLAVEKASAFVESAIADTVKDLYNPNDGVNFEKYLKMLVM